MSLKVKSLFTKSARNDEEKIEKWKNVAAFSPSDDQKVKILELNSSQFNYAQLNFTHICSKEHHLRGRARACAHVYHLVLACVSKGRKTKTTFLTESY